MCSLLDHLLLPVVDSVEEVEVEEKKTTTTITLDSYYEWKVQFEQRVFHFDSLGGNSSERIRNQSKLVAIIDLFFFLLLLE